MTSISGSSSPFASRATQFMQTRLQSAVSNGTVNASDQNALSSALTNIGNQLQPPSSGGSMQSQVSGLIDGEVSNGKLTTDQANELKAVFAKAAGKMHGHHHGGGAAPADPTDPTTASSTDSTTTLATAANSAVQSLTDFLGEIRTAISSNSPYAANGTQSGSLASTLLSKLA
jgi:hypothetical protein